MPNLDPFHASVAEAGQVRTGRPAYAQKRAQQSTHIVCQDGSRVGLQGGRRDKAEPEPVIGRRRDPGAHRALQGVDVHLYPQVHPAQPHTQREQGPASARTSDPVCSRSIGTAILCKRHCRVMHAIGTGSDRQSCRRMLQEGQQRCEGWAWHALGDVLSGDLCQVAHALGGKVAQPLQLPHLLLRAWLAASRCTHTLHYTQAAEWVSRTCLMQVRTIRLLQGILLQCPLPASSTS